MNSTEIGRPRALGAHAGSIEPFDQRAAVQHAGQRVGLRALLGGRQRRRLRAQAVRGAERDEHRGGHHRGGQSVIEEPSGAVRARVQQPQRREDLEGAQQRPGDQEPAGGAIAAARQARKETTSVKTAQPRNMRSPAAATSAENPGITRSTFAAASTTKASASQPKAR